MNNFNFKKIVIIHYKAIAFLIVILILSLSWLFLLRKEWQNFRKMQVTVLKNTTDELAVTESTYLKFKKEVSNADILLGQRFSKLKAMLPDKKDMPLFYLQILQTLKNLDLAVVSLDIAEAGVDLPIPNAQFPIKEVELKISLNEPLDYIALKRLLAKLYRQAPLLNIKAIVLNSSPEAQNLAKKFESNDKQSSGSSLILYTYYIDKPAASAESGLGPDASVLNPELLPPSP